MKRIVFLHPVIFEQFSGGAELQIYYLAKVFRELGWKVYYIAIDHGVVIINTEGEINLLKKISLRKTLGSLRFIYGTRILKLLKRIDPDIIYTRGYSSWAGIASKYSKSAKSYHFMSIASDNDVDKHVNMKLLIRPFDFIESLYVNYAFRFASKIFVQNGYQEASIKRLYNRNSILLPQIYGDELKEPDYSVKENLTVLWIANMKLSKQPELFIELASRFTIRDKIKFIMIGRLDKRLSSLINKAHKEFPHFKYVGELPNYDVNNYLANADVLVNTSKFEGFSNTFIQAWLNATVVLSMNSNPDEVIVKNKLGFMCPEVRDIEAALKILRKNPKKLIEMKRQAYNYAKRKHTIKGNINILKEAFNVQ
ncbi:MAG: glycosyltransferase family 4 protein [Clostridiaceae bacterium]|nr:glycosyltransferase family 4 protein [Clostridiaceae bacterium]